MLSTLTKPARAQTAPAVRQGPILRLKPSQAGAFITPEQPGDQIVISLDVSGSMEPFFGILRSAAERVLEWCKLLGIPPGSVKIVFWSSRLNGEVTNSGCAETDLGVLAAISFGGGTDYNRGLEHFSVDTVNLIVTDGADYGNGRWKKDPLDPMKIEAVFIGPALPTGEFRSNLERIAPTTRLVEYAPSHGRTTEEHHRSQEMCAEQLANLIIATMTRAMPAGPSVQVATRSGQQSVPLDVSLDDSLVGVVPFGAISLLAPDGQTLPIEPGRIPPETAIAAPTEEISRLARRLLRAVETGATDLQKELAGEMEGMINILMAMLKKHGQKHPDIEAYRALLHQVKRISRSGDAESTQPIAFFEGMVARTVGFVVSNRLLKAAAKVAKLELGPEQLKMMTAAKAVIGGMVPGPTGIASVVHGSATLKDIAAGVQHPQAFCLPSGTEVSIIPPSRLTVEQVSEAQTKQSLLLPDLPDGHEVTLEMIQMMVAALLALNINPNASMLLCLVSIAGQLAEDGHNDAAQILLGWFKHAIPHIWKDPQQMVAIVNAASDPHAFILLRKDAQIAKPASPRDLHLLAGMLMEYLDTQGIKYPPIPADALRMTKLVLRLIRAKKQDPNLGGLIEQAVRAVTDWTFDADNNFEPVPSECNFGAAAAALHPLLDEKMTEASPPLAGGVVDVVAPLQAHEPPAIPNEAFVLAALCGPTGPMPKTLTGVVKPGPAQLAAQKRLCVQAFTAEWLAAIKKGNLQAFLEHLATCYDGFQPNLLCPGNGAHEEMAKILLTGSPGCTYTPANLGEERLNEVATFLLDAIRGNSATIQRLAVGKHPLNLIQRPQLKLLLKADLITVDEFHEACPPEAGPVPGSTRFQKTVRRVVEKIAARASNGVILIKRAKPGSPAERELLRTLRNAGVSLEECVTAPLNFVHPTCAAYILEPCPHNKGLQVTRIVLADGTTVDALKKEGRTTGADYETINISWKGHDAFAHLQTATEAAPVMSAAANELHRLAADISAVRKDCADFM